MGRFDRRRFDRAGAEERSTYHSVSHSEKQPAKNATSPFEYQAPTLPEGYESTIPAFNSRLNLARCIPQDGRIELGFDFHWQAQEDTWFMPRQGSPTNGHDARGNDLAQAKSNVESLGSFFQQDFQTFGAFIVRDIDPSKPDDDVLYNIGNETPYINVPSDPHSDARHQAKEIVNEGNELVRWLREQKLFCQVDPPPSGIAPWQRIILCQGLSLVSPAKRKKRSLPFLVFDVLNDPIRMATDLHLSGERRGGSEATNPYSNPHNAFHITFYERLPESNSDGLIKARSRSNLKIGRLYNKPGGVSDKNDDELAFWQSSFTMITTAKRTQRTQKKSQPHSPSNGEYYWTMLILSPSGFFPLPTEQFSGIDWKVDAGQTSQQTAELSCIVLALREVEKRWRQFNEHIGSLLVEDFMDPKAYTKLLFDDETFSRSRLYFWILGCLNEFDISIEDNIKQWKLFRQARIRHLLDPPPKSSPDLSPESSPDSSPESSPEPSSESWPLQFDRSRDLARLRELDKEAGEIRQSLEDLQAQFQAKQATVQALRDGLFSASALIESRSSTKLGQNVQLLTYVSIFYLPLAFCAALWAIPNITDGETRNPFIITAFVVGFATYAVVFNLGNIADVLGRAYFSRRTRLLQKMGEDDDPRWQKRRERFEEFPPNEERKAPSEWWIIRFQMRRLFRRKGAKAASTDGAGTA